MFYGKRSSLFEQHQNANPAGQELAFAWIGPLGIHIFLKALADVCEATTHIHWIHPTATEIDTHNPLIQLHPHIDTVIALGHQDRCWRVSMRQQEAPLFTHKVVLARDFVAPIKQSEDLLTQNLLAQGLIQTNEAGKIYASGVHPEGGPSILHREWFIVNDQDADQVVLT